MKRDARREGVPRCSRGLAIGKWPHSPDPEGANVSEDAYCTEPAKHGYPTNMDYFNAQQW